MPDIDVSKVPWWLQKRLYEARQMNLSVQEATKRIAAELANLGYGNGFLPEGELKIGSDLRSAIVDVMTSDYEEIPIEV